MTLQKIAEFYTQWFSVCSNTTSKFCTTATCISFVKKIIFQINLVGISTILHCTKLHFCNGS
jgi:hypothetical protein